MADVFISYSSEDRNLAEQIVSEFERNNISCWIDRNNISAGAYFGEEIPEAILNCSVLLLLISEHSQKSKYVLMELDWATSHDKFIIPIVISNCTIIPKFGFLLQNKQRYYVSSTIDIPITASILSHVKKLLSNNTLVQNHDTVELAHKKDIRCPACGSSDYYARRDYLDRCANDKAAVDKNRIMSAVFLAIAFTLIFSFLILSLGGIMTENVIDNIRISQLKQNDELKLAQIEAIIKTLEMTRNLFVLFRCFFLSISSMSMILALFYSNPSEIDKCRKSYRVRKHIEVYKLTCCQCEKRFKHIIRLDGNNAGTK